MKKLLLAGILIALITGCSKEEPTEPTVPETAAKAYILNGLSETVSIYSLEDDSVYLHVFETGNTPNFILFSGDLGYIVNSGFTGDPSITVFDPENNEVVATFSLPAGSNPWAAATMDGKLYVTLMLMDMVYVLDINTGEVIDSIATKRRPEGIVSDSSYIYVACTGINPDWTYGPGWLLKIDPANNIVCDSLQIGVNLQALCFDRDGRLHVLATGDYSNTFGRIYLIDPDGLTLLDSLDIGGSPGFIVITENDIAYLTDWSYGLLSYNASDLTPIRTADNPIDVGIGAMGLDYDSDGRIYVTIYSTSETNWLKVVEGDSVVNSYDLGAATGATFIKFFSNNNQPF